MNSSQDSVSLQQACSIAGGQSALARLLGVSAVTVNQWIKRERPVPAVRCVQIEIVTAGVVKRQELRPTDYWLIWPDLPAPKAARKGKT